MQFRKECYVSLDQIKLEIGVELHDSAEVDFPEVYVAKVLQICSSLQHLTVLDVPLLRLQLGEPLVIRRYTAERVLE